MSEFFLEMRNITKTFPGVKAVDNVSLQVKKGTVHALMGENGAGKSTMMKILAGEHMPDEGEIYLDGKKLEISNTHDAITAGISTIYQELNLVPEMTIAENMFLGQEPKNNNGIFVDAKYIYSETEKHLKEIQLKYSPNTKLKELSVSAQQMVEIAKGMSRGSELIVLDEPTSAITEAEVKILFSLINQLKEKGITFIYISHKLDEIFEIADDVTVMRDGGWVDTSSVKDLNQNKLVTLMVGRELKELFPKTKVPIGDVAFEAKNLTREGVFEDISFHVREWEILGLSGLMGAGRTEVARAIFGLDSLDEGKMTLAGLPYHVDNPQQSIFRGVAYVSEDRKKEGLCLALPIYQNIALPNLKMFRKFGFLHFGEEKEVTSSMAKKLDVKTHSLYVRTDTLSGGNQQKVVLSKWLIRNLKLLILDEPTRGIDVGAKSEIHKLMCEFASHGMAVIMISSELPEILGMSDRILVMQEGKLRGEFTREEATQEKIMALAAG